MGLETEGPNIFVKENLRSMFIKRLYMNASINRPIKTYLAALTSANSIKEIKSLIKIDRWSKFCTILGIGFAAFDVYSDIFFLHQWVSNGNKLWVIGFFILAINFLVNFLRVSFVNKEANILREFYISVISQEDNIFVDFPKSLKESQSKLKTNGHCQSTKNLKGELPCDITIKDKEADGVTPHHKSVSKLYSLESEALMLANTKIKYETEKLLYPINEIPGQRLKISRLILEDSIPKFQESPIFFCLYLLSALAPSFFMNTMWLIGAKKVKRILENKDTFNNPTKLYQLYATSSFLYFLKYQAAEACKLELLLEAIPQLMIRILPVLNVFLRHNVQNAVDKIGMYEVNQILISFLSIGYLMTASMLKKYEFYNLNEKRNKPKLSEYPKMLLVLCNLGHILTIGTIIVGAALVFISSVTTGVIIFILCNFAVLPYQYSKRKSSSISISKLFLGWSSIFSPLHHCKKSLCLRIICRNFLCRGLVLLLVLFISTLQLTLLRSYPPVNSIIIASIVFFVHLLGDLILIIERLLSNETNQNNFPSVTCALNKYI